MTADVHGGASTDVRVGGPGPLPSEPGATSGATTQGSHPADAAATGGPAGLRPERLITGLLVFLVLGQRFGVTIGESSVSLTIPAVFLVLGVLLWRGRARVDRFRAELFTVAVVGVMTVTAVAGMTGGLPTPTSLMLLLGIHLPWIFRASIVGPDQVRRLGRTFVNLMVGVATVGVLQLGAQLAGLWRWEDLLASVVGEGLLVQDFNDSNALFYDSPVFKSTAFVMLEPSFLAQYCALAVLIGVVLRVRAWQLVVLVAGLASSVSGTGILLLVVGGLLVLFRSPRAFRPSYAVAAGAALALVLLSPVAGLLLDRTDEATQPGTSGYQRFVAPYEETLEGLQDDPERYLLGAGAGGAERLLDSTRAGQLGQAVVYTTVPKLVFEYGLPAGGLFVLFIVVSMVDRVPWRVVPGALLFMTFVLSGALLQAHTAYLAWLLTAFWAGDDPVPATDPRRSGPAAG